MYTQKLVVSVLILNSYLTSVICDSKATKLKATSFVTCKGPKRRDCTSLRLHIEGGVVLSAVISVFEDVTITHGKTVGTMQGVEVIKLQGKSPCKNFVLGTIFKLTYNITEDCTILKGNYHMSINIEDFNKKFYHGRFMPGNLTVKSLYYGDNCNFVCAILKVTFT